MTGGLSHALLKMGHKIFSMLRWAAIATVLFAVSGPATASVQAAPLGIAAASPTPAAGQHYTPPNGWQTRVAQSLGSVKTQATKPQRLSSVVHDFATAAGAQDVALLAAEKGAHLEQNRVLVEVQAVPGQSAAANSAVKATGGTVKATYRDWIDALVPPSRLSGLEYQSSIKWVDVPAKLQPMATDEALGQINATTWQSAGLTGAGVKVGIIDGGFSGYSSLLGNALPQTVDTTCSPNDPNLGDPHGTAVAEIMHAVAPDSPMYFALINTPVELGNAVTCFASKGVNVTNMSAAFAYDGPGDGTGLVQSIVDTGVVGGMFWANAAGNYALSHWSGPWVGDPAASSLLDFAAGNPFEGVHLIAGEPLVAQLRWNDPWGASCNDYDLFLFDPSANIVAESTNTQDCSQNPTEILSYVPPADGYYALVVSNFDANGSAHFDLVALTQQGPLDFTVAANSLAAPADSRNTGMASVGAVAWNTPATIENFSSQGPTTDGRVKPDIVGPDRVSTVSFGSQGFAGTSASSPHVAGAAALVKQAEPDFSPAQIKSFLLGRAVDLGTPGADNVFGVGRLFLGAPVAPQPAKLVVTLPTPVRLADTRTAGGPIQSGASRCFAVAGLMGIPPDAGAVILNVTAVAQTTNGWLTVYPNGQGVPATSTLNFGTSEYAMANGSIMRVGTGDQVCVNVGTVNSTPGSSQVILDATGYLPGSTLNQLSMLPAPVRLADTRTAGGAVGTGGSQCFQIAGVGGIPADAAAVLLNVTATGYTTDGWLTAYPNGQVVPQTSTVNFDQSEYAMANNAIMRIGSGGQVCINVGTVNSVPGASQIILDAQGYLTSSAVGQLPMLASPQRVVDTRISGGPIPTGNSRCFTLAGVAGVPSNASGVLINVTGVGYPTRGWLTAYPAGQGIPATSTVNFDTSQYAVANGAIVGIGTAGQVCVSVGTVNSVPGPSQVIVDVVGYLTP